MVQIIARTGPTEVSYEASDDLWIRGGRPARCRNHHAAVALAFGQPSYRDRRHDVAESRGRANKFPIEEFEDKSLIYSTVPKR